MRNLLLSMGDVLRDYVLAEKIAQWGRGIKEGEEERGGIGTRPQEFRGHTEAQRHRGIWEKRKKDS